MKTGNIGIKSPAYIGISDIDVYGTNPRKYEAFERTEKVKLRIGVFFDGTGNNRFNSDSVYYNKRYHKELLKENDIKKIEGFKSFVIESGSSYWNSYSNITLLYDLYQEIKDRSKEQNPKFQELQLKVYMQGIGTLRDEKDDILGSGIGEGLRGVISRVEQACQEIANTIETALENIQNTDNSKPWEIISIQFDVFGFSRGAAAARHFCNEVLKSGRDKNPGNGGGSKIINLKRPSIKNYVDAKDQLPDIKQSNADAYKKVKDNTNVVQQFNAPAANVFIGGMLGELLSKKGISYPKYNVSVEFLGIFDTVISQMLERKGIIDKAKNPITQALSATLSPVVNLLTNAVAEIPKVDTGLSNPNIRKILHIKAKDEWRDNFAITLVGNIASTTYAKEITVLGAHSDVGGGYWQTEKELNTLQFFDLAVGADASEKQKLEKQKDLLRKWYIDQNLGNDTQLTWKIMHHVRAYTLSGSMDDDLESHINKSKYLLLEPEFMGEDVYKVEDGWHYKLQGYHHKLLSERPLDNKLSLAYMNVMKQIALNYADVPFRIPENETPHPEEYIYAKETETNMRAYQNLIFAAAEHGWTDKNGKLVTHPELVDDKGYYTISKETNNFIMGNFVHLSANFNTPFLEALDHLDFAYANVPHFTNEKEFKDPPYKREAYTPVLSSAG